MPCQALSEDRVAPEAITVPGTTMHLLRADVQALEEGLRDDIGDVDEYPLRGELGAEGRLYVRKNKSRSPYWLSFVSDAVGTRVRGVSTRQAQAVLLYRSAGRIIAVTFGLGRYLLALDRCVPDFGLRVALNSVDPDRIRSVDGRAIEDIIVHTRRQGSRGVAVEGLGLETRREMMRAITGVPVDDDIGTRVSGTGSLSIAKAVSVEDMVARTPRLIELYESERYRERFGYVDRIRPIDDAALMRELDERLVRALGAPEHGGVYLAEPEIVDFANIAGYRYAGEAREAPLHTALELADYLSVRGQPQDAEELRRHRVELIGGDTDAAVRSWTIYQALVFELTRGGQTYVLSEGSWFSVNRDYVSQIDDALADIPLAALDLPDSRPGETERDYNERAGRDNTDWATLDRNTVTFPGERGPVEVCDLFTSGRHLVHVKRGMSASDLSHLFNQGVTSAELWRNSAHFRDQARSKLLAIRAPLADLVPHGRPERDEFEVVYAVVTAEVERVPLRLPFFSRLSLARCVEQLRNLDFRVSVRGVRVPNIAAARRPRPRRAA